MKKIVSVVLITIISVSFGLTVFSSNTYTINTSAPINLCTISPGHNAPNIVNAGSSQTFTITPKPGKTIEVFIDGASQGSITSYTFTNVQSNHTLSVTDTTPNVSPSNPSGGGGSGGGTFGGNYDIAKLDGFEIPAGVIDLRKGLQLKDFDPIFKAVQNNMAVILPIGIGLMGILLGISVIKVIRSYF